jgi:hypothetical protein
VKTLDKFSTSMIDMNILHRQAKKTSEAKLWLQKSGVVQIESTTSAAQPHSVTIASISSCPISRAALSHCLLIHILPTKML